MNAESLYSVIYDRRAPSPRSGKKGGIMRPLMLGLGAELAAGAAVEGVFYCGVLGGSPQENHVQAVQLLGTGDAFNAGLMCANGMGMERNAAEAAKWYAVAAEQGHAQAQFFLGLLYANGDGIPADAEQARVWFSRAAAQGLDEAAILLEQL